MGPRVYCLLTSKQRRKSESIPPRSTGSSLSLWAPGVTVFCPPPSGRWETCRVGIHSRLRNTIRIPELSSLCHFFKINIVCDRNKFFLSSHWAAILLKLKTVSGGPAVTYLVVSRGQLLSVTGPKTVRLTHVRKQLPYRSDHRATRDLLASG